MKKYSGYLITVPILLGSLTIIGWIFSIDLLKRPMSSDVSMNPMTAICFILSGTAFILDFKLAVTKWLTILSASLSTIVALIGALKLLELWGINIQIDSLLFNQTIMAENMTGRISRMAPNTALCFVLIGLSFLLARSNHRYLRVTLSYLALTIFVIALFAFIGHIYHVKEYYGILHYMPMAELTALSFIFLSVALLLENDDKKFMQVISSPYIGGKIARSLIPIVILVPVSLGYLRLALNWWQPITVELGVAALITSIIVIFFVVIWFLARALNASDASRHEIRQLYQRMVQEVQDYAILSMDINGNIINWNKGAEKIEGYSEEEIIGKNFRIFYTSEANAQQMPEQMLKEAQADGRTRKEGWIVRKDGSTFWAGVVITALHDENNNVIGYSKVTRDLTERKQAEVEMLRQAELFSTMPDGVIYGRRDLTVTSLNKAAENLFEVEADQVIGRKMYEIVRNDMTDDIRKEASVEIWERKGTWRGETTFTTKSGKKVIVQVTLKAVNDTTDNAWFGIYTDITKLKETQHRLEFALDGMVAGLWEWDMVHDTRWWSPVYFALLGYDNNEIPPSAETLRQLIHPDDVDWVFQTISTYANKNEGFEIENRFKLKNGDSHWFRVTGKTKFDEAGRPLLMSGSIIDIDEKKKARQTIEQQALLIQTIPDGIVYSDMNFRIISLNKGAEDMIGINSLEAIGKRLDELVTLTMPPSTREQIRKDLAEKGFIRQEIEIINSHGKKMTLLATTRMYNNLKGMEPGWVSIYTDIGPLRLNEELQLANNYLEQLAFISAHDIKSPIHSLSGLADVLSRSPNLKQEDMTLLQMLKEVILQMQKTNLGLNDILKLREGLKSKEMMYADILPLSAIIDNIKTTLRSDIENSGARLDIDLHDTAALAFPFYYLQSVFQNLILNGIKYRSMDRVPHIRFEAKMKTPDTVCFTISDNGLGFDTERNKDKLFGIFKRFHPNIPGTGIGLHIVKSIIDAYGGEIAVHSDVGRGTTFEIVLKKTNLV